MRQAAPYKWWQISTNASSKTKCHPSFTWLLDSNKSIKVNFAISSTHGRCMPFQSPSLGPQLTFKEQKCPILIMTSSWLLIRNWSWIVREHTPSPTDLPSLLLHHIRRERTKQSWTLMEDENNFPSSISALCKCWHLREREQLQTIPTSWLLNTNIPKSAFTSARIAEYFVRENGNEWSRKMVKPSSTQTTERTYNCWSLA